MKTRRMSIRMLAMLVALAASAFALVGGTIAWFTDEVVSSENIIKSGTLDVEMDWAEGKDDPADEGTAWKNAAEGKIFDYDLWEPGYVQVRHIRIRNVGNLAFKYQLNILANGEVSKLSDAIDVYFLDPAEKIATRADLEGLTPIGTLTDVLAGMPENTSGSLLAGDDATVTIALKMRESAGNEYMDLSIGSNFSVQLLATQLTYENDAFDDQYDAESKMTMTVGTETQLASIVGGLNNSENMLLTGDGIENSMLISDGDTIDADGLTISDMTIETSDASFGLTVIGDNTNLNNVSVDMSADVVQNTSFYGLRFDGANAKVQNVKFKGGEQSALMFWNFSDNADSVTIVDQCVFETVNIEYDIEGLGKIIMPNFGAGVRFRGFYGTVNVTNSSFKCYRHPALDFGGESGVPRGILNVSDTSIVADKMRIVNMQQANFTNVTMGNSWLKETGVPVTEDLMNAPENAAYLKMEFNLSPNKAVFKDCVFTSAIQFTSMANKSVEFENCEYYDWFNNTKTKITADNIKIFFTFTNFAGTNVTVDGTVVGF